MSQDLGGFREQIAKGAFTRALKERQDVRALFNHSPDKILGRTASGTLKLEQDDRGLKMRCQLDPNQQWQRDLYSAVLRGDVNSMSFGFTCPEGGDSWDEAIDEEDRSRFARRTLLDVNLLDVSPVVYPAYLETSLSARDFAPSVQRALLTLNNESWRQRMLQRARTIGEQIRRDQFCAMTDAEIREHAVRFGREISESLKEL